MKAFVPPGKIEDAASGTEPVFKYWNLVTWNLFILIPGKVFGVLYPEANIILRPWGSGREALRIGVGLLGEKKTLSVAKLNECF